MGNNKIGNLKNQNLRLCSNQFGETFIFDEKGEQYYIEKDVVNQIISSLELPYYTKKTRKWIDYKPHEHIMVRIENNGIEGKQVNCPDCGAIIKSKIFNKTEVFSCSNCDFVVLNEIREERKPKTLDETIEESNQISSF